MTLRGTQHQLRSLDALVLYGTYREASHRLRISEAACRRHVRLLRERNGLTMAQLAYRRGVETREAAA